MEIINSSEITSERFDYAKDFIRNISKRSYDWKSFYGIASITEAYARGDIEIHLHIFLSPNPTVKITNENTFFGEGVNRGNFCIRIQRCPYFEVGTTTYESLEFISSNSGSQNSDEAMFIGIIQLMKKKKGAIPSLIPSLVWLKCFDFFHMSLSEAFGDVRAFLSTPKMRDEFAINSPLCATNKVNRESSFRVGSEFIRTSKLPCQNIKSGTEVMNNLPNHHAPLSRKNGCIFDLYTIASSISLKLGSDSIDIMFEEPLKSLIQGYELALCPLNLNSWPDKSMHMLQYPQGDNNDREKTKNSQGVRDTRTLKRRVRAKSQKDCQAEQINASQSSEVTPQTSNARRLDDYIAKNTHSGSLEDA